MLPPWLRQLKKRFLGQSATAPIRAKRANLHIEALEDRSMPTAIWTGGAVGLPANQNPSAFWSDARNWNHVPGFGEDVIFPALTGANKPPAVIVNGVFFFPNGTHDPATPTQPINGGTLANSIIDQDFTIGELQINDDNYHIDALTANTTLTISGRILANIPEALGSLVGLSLIGPLSAPAGGGLSNLRIQLNGPNQEIRSDNVGILRINASIIDSSSGESGLLKLGSGTISLGGNNFYTGSVAVREGTLVASSDTALGTTDKGTSVDALPGSPIGATLSVSNGANILESLVLTGAGVGGAGALSSIDDQFRTFANFIQPTPNGTWAGGITLDGDVSIGGTGDFVISLDPSLPLIGSISGSGNLTKVGSSILEFFSPNTYAGNTLIRSGGIYLHDNNGLSNSQFSTTSTTVFTGAALLLDGGLTVPETLFLNGNGFADAAGRPTGALALTPGLAPPNSEYTGTITLQTASSIGAVGFTELLLTGALGGAVGLTKVDQGNVRIARANDGVSPAGFPAFTGNTTVANGTLEIANALALGTAGTVSVTSTIGTTAAVGTLQMEGNYTFTRPLILAGVGFNTTGAIHLIDQAAGGSSAISLTGGVTLQTVVGLTAAASIQTDPGDALTVASTIAGTPAAGAVPAASLEKTGLGTLNLINNNTYTGTTALRAGLTTISTAQGLGGAGGDGTRVFAGATLKFNNAVGLVENLTLSGTGFDGNGVLQVPAGVSSVTGLVSLLGQDTTRADLNVATGGTLNFLTTVSGDADLHKLGGGLLRMAGTADNTFTATTFLETGTIALAKPSGKIALGGPVIVGDGIGGNNVDVLLYEGSNQVPETVNAQPLLVSVLSSGLINLNGFTETYGGLRLTGGEVTTGAGFLTLASTLDVVGSPDVSRINGSTALGTVALDSPTPGETGRTISTRGVAGMNFFTSADPVQFQSPVTFTVQLTTAGGPAVDTNATVVFTRIDPATGFRFTIGTGFVNGAGVATFTSSSLPAGSFTIEAAFSGDANYAPQVVNLPSTLEVIGAPTRALLSSNRNPTTGGLTFTYTATRVSTNNPQPTGTVTFFANGNPIGSGTINAGVATLSTFLAVGTYTITASYSGDAFNAAETATLGVLLNGVQFQQVVVGAPQFQVSVNPNPVVVGGTVSYTFTATPAAGSPTPTGTVTISVNGQVQATGQLTNGVFTSPVIGAPAAAGDFPVTVQYSGDAFYEAQTVSALPLLKVLAAPAATASLNVVSSNKNSSQVGDPVTFKFTVIPTTTPVGPTATGSVTFLSDGIPLNGTPAPLIGGSASFTTLPNQLTAGNHVITAIYSGDANYPGGGTAMAPNQFVFNPLAVQLISSQNPAPTAANGQAITFSFIAGRQTPNDPQPTGTVTFFDGATMLGAAAVALSPTGTASISINNLTFGTHQIKAVYSGDGNYPATTVTLAPAQVVSNPATFRVTSSAPTALTGQNVTFTFTGQPQTGTPTPTGTVTFFANGVPIPGGSNVALSGGTASVLTSFGTTGSKTITAQYSGDAFHAPFLVTLQPAQQVVTTIPNPPTTPAVVAPQGASLEVNGVLSGTAGVGVIKNGLGTAFFNGVNTYSGQTHVASGTLTLGVNNALPDTPATVDSTGTLNVNGVTDTVASLSGSGTLALGTGSFTTGLDGTSTTFSGPITGAGTLTKIGAGTLTLSGVSPLYTGTTVVAGGTVLVNANQGGATVNVGAGTVLGGTGTVGTVNVAAGGTVSPGVAGPGKLTTNGQVTFNAASAFVAQVNGTTTGTFDQLAVTGGAVPAAGKAFLNSATLVLTFGAAFNPAPGTQVSILTATGGLNGTFRDQSGNVLADNAVFTADGLIFRLNYTATDVVLTLVAYAVNVTLTSSSNPEQPNVPVTFTATYTPVRSGAPTLTGTVLLKNNGVQFGTGTLTAGNSTIVGTTSFPAPGVYTITAEYAGNANYQPSVTTLTPSQVVNIITAMSLTTSKAGAVFGDAVTFTATVTGAGGTPSGTVTFVNPATGQVFGTVGLSGGVAQLTTTGLPTGRFTVQAIYSGDPTFRGSSTALAQSVTAVPLVATGTVGGGTVTVYDPQSGQVRGSGDPFGPYTGGVKVASGDVNGDGFSDLIMMAGPGAQNGHIIILSGRDLSLLADYRIGYGGEMNIASGDVDGDGRADVVLSSATDFDYVAVVSGTSTIAPNIITAYSVFGGLRLGVTLAVGDFDGDGKADVYAGTAKPFDASKFGAVVVVNGLTGATMGTFLLPLATQGVSVAAADVNGDGRDDVAIGTLTPFGGIGPIVGVYDAASGGLINGFAAFPGQAVGVNLSATDKNGDGKDEIVASFTAGVPVVGFYTFDPSSNTFNILDGFLAPGGNTAKGLNVGGS